MSDGRGRVGLERECMFKLYIIHDIIALDLIELTAKLAGITWAAGSSFAQ